MATTKVSALAIGRGTIADNTHSPHIFSANAPVNHWSAVVSYSQFNVVENAGAVWRAKVGGNLNNVPSGSPNHWERIYNAVKDGDFCVVYGSGATIQQRQAGQWLIFGNHPAAWAVYEESLTISNTIPAPPLADNYVLGPVVAGTPLILPLDSRESNTVETYIVGSGDLEVWINGALAFEGDDWTAIGLPGSSSSAITVNFDLTVTDKIVFRRNSFTNLTGYGGGGGGGGGGSGSLQDAYDIGNTINATPGRPVTVIGSSGKCAQFYGDIGVTGIIDPAALTFSLQPTDPIPGQYGIFADASGDLIYRKNSITFNLTANVTAEATAVMIKNDSGFTITAGTPVSLDVNGKAKVTDVSLEIDAETFLGIAIENIPNGSAGKVATNGKVKNVTTTASFGDSVFVSKTSGITNIPPDRDINGFVTGDWVIKLGMISQNIDNPLQKDLIIISDNLGQL